MSDSTDIEGSENSDKDGSIDSNTVSEERIDDLVTSTSNLSTNEVVNSTQSQENRRKKMSPSKECNDCAIFLYIIVKFRTSVHSAI